MITALTFAPLLAALLIMALPERRARVVALVGALASLGMVVCLLLRFVPAEGLQSVEKIPWIPGSGLDYFVGISVDRRFGKTRSSRGSPEH